MKKKRLSPREVKARIIETLNEIVQDQYGVAKDKTTQLIPAYVKQGMETALVQALLDNVLRTLLSANVKEQERGCIEEELHLVLAKLKASAPEIASRSRKMFKDLSKILPRRGGPGRSESLTVVEKQEACEQIGSLFKLGHLKRWPDIYEAVAESFRLKGKKVSARTVRRIWEKRDSLYVG